MIRKCVVCGAKIQIALGPGGKYDNGHYFGVMKLPVGKGKYEKIGRSKFGRHSFDVVKWTGKEKEIEYWECNDCWKEAGKDQEGGGKRIKAHRARGMSASHPQARLA
ncbi:MAG: hypothetical protein V1708_05855 [Candidatus Micrarchaeota archaeon]